MEDYAPGFKDSIIGTDILMPPDLERILGLTGGVSTSWLLGKAITLTVIGYR